jgi:anaerobic magnesium-protoporphyrin IX monomethyl ester cyclase
MQLVYIGEDLSAIGFRKMAALYPDAEKIFLPLQRRAKLDADKIAAHLTDRAIAMSFMSNGADVAKALSAKTKQHGCRQIIWGGMHPTLFPQESLQWADSVCVGEGELLVGQLYPGINRSHLLTNAELEQQPLAYNEFDCTIYDNGFKQLTEETYLKYSGSLYRTLWVRGCAFSCAYCANSSLIAIDPDYRKLRHVSVSYIIDEVLSALAMYPFITTVCFDDDNFISLPVDTIADFCLKWKSRVKMPFVIMGMHPNAVTMPKVSMLCEAGMNRVRMGIQSGQRDVLNFYHRKTPISRIRESATVLATAARAYKMVPPCYDVIADSFDSVETLDFFQSLPRPYTLAVFSLRIMPRTYLAEMFPEQARADDLRYLNTKPTWYSIALYLLSMFRLPGPLFRWIRKKEGNAPRWIHRVVKSCFMAKKHWDHLRRGDISKIKGWTAVALWKLRQAWRRT